MAVEVGRQGKHCQEELVLGRGAVKQLSAWVVIQAGDCRKQQSLWHTGPLEEQGQFSTEWTVRGNIVSVAQRGLSEGTESAQHGDLVTGVFPFHRTVCTGMESHLSLSFGKVRKTLKWKQPSCNISCC